MPCVGAITLLFASAVKRLPRGIVVVWVFHTLLSQLFPALSKRRATDVTLNMAATNGSGNSSLAPTDFRLCSSLDDSHGTVISVAVEHCQLCGGTRRLFYCKDCVAKGEFSHSLRKHEERCVVGLCNSPLW